MRLSIGFTKSIKSHFTTYQMEYPILTHIESRKPTRLNLTCSWDPRGRNSSRSRTARPPKLGDKWTEYQGCNNWSGMLDPLDECLRGEILRYGEFVEAAYRSFEFETSSPNYATCKHSKKSMLNESGFNGTGYKVTRNLHATCGVQLPRWVDRAPEWVPIRSSWIGYVAVCTDKEEIARLGRRDVVIAFRGTATCLEWLENFRAMLTCLNDDKGSDRDNDTPMVESGFLSLYTSESATCPSLQSSIKNEIRKIQRLYGDEPLSVTIVGHSLGAALATLTAYDITTTCEHAPPVTVMSFGGPRVGNKSFRSQLEKNGTKVLRIVNSDDLITKVPGFVIDNNDTWLKQHVENTRLSYADVGRELRLSSKESPYISKGDVAACHDLKTYLHLVDGFVSSACPFRATAKNVLNKMHHNKQLEYSR